MAPVLRRLQWTRFGFAQLAQVVSQKTRGGSPGVDVPGRVVLVLALVLALPAAAQVDPPAPNREAAATAQAAGSAAPEAAAETAGQTAAEVEKPLDAAGQAVQEPAAPVEPYDDEDAEVVYGDARGASQTDEEEEEDFFQSDLWVPTATFALSVHDEQMDLVAENPVAFSINSEESRTLVAIRFGGELMSPVVDEIPLSPRFFVSGGVLWSPPGNSLYEIREETTETNDYRDTNLDEALRVFDRQLATNPDAAADAEPLDFEGQGNRVWGRQRHNAWYASFGTVFAIPRSGYAFRIRPSVEYTGEVFDNEGEFALVVDNSGPADAAEFYVSRIALSKRQTYHSLGPGLELEMMNQLDSGVTLSFFLQTRFMWILNDPGIKLRGPATFADDAISGPADITTVDLSDLEFTVDRNRFNFRGGMGIRIGFRDLGFGLW